MINGIGIDIIEIDRIERSIQKFQDKFLNKIYTQKEIDYCNKKAKPFQHFAVRFAAKEAVSKAFGTGIGSFISFKEIEILNNEYGKPEIFISGKSNQDIKLSISHSNNYAIAMAIIENI